MRVGIYARPGLMAASEAANGLAGAGHKCVWRRPNVYRRGEVEAFDLVLIVGFKGSSAEVSEDYRARGVPVISMDIPSVPTPPGADYYRFSLAGPEWLFPPGPDGERAGQLGLNLFFSPGRRGSSVIVLGQQPGDSAHGLATKADLTAWAEDVAKRCREQFDAPLIWRPHPSDTSPRPRGFDAVSLAPLEDDLRSAYAVVTISSGAALVALRHGVPVVGLGPSPFAHLAAEIKHLPRLKPPAREDVEDLFARLAWQHWSRREIAAGLPMNVFVKLAVGETIEWPKRSAPPAVAAVEPAEPEKVPAEVTPKRPARRTRKRKGAG